ncbi:M20/M25/M40 family metallo-hydrolase [Mesobacillus harenae]|uniref:M20/M25/M40 family metallo-hydrolase n=1 Tax=Mesobacillus harenae TaxID=2213203 RepID=UPI00158044C3|nr:M20/M25/M40 family metallo-hydrolase [Mesobacillus harenae]
MKNWNQLFIRHGWKLAEKKENFFDIKGETEENISFLLECLEKSRVQYKLNGGMLSLPALAISEEDWLEAVSFQYRGRGEGLWFRPGVEEPKLRELDVYISGIVRQLNRLGFYTAGSCDGHGNRTAHVMITLHRTMEELSELLHALGLKRVHVREQRNSFHLSLPLQQTELLDLAEKLSLIEESWIGQGYDFIKEKIFYVLLENLLAIPGVSGREERVREFVKERLAPFVDFITVDRAGNLLAEKTYRTGNGPVILLNAHLDTVFEIESGREILKDGRVWYSSKGILGADDRAGIAILLHIAEQLHLSSTFSGKVKFIFTVEEECGLVGASQVDEYFLWGTDAAIVVDRSGKGDIVTSCGGYIPFCDASYGTFFEEAAAEEELKGWAATIGGSSDTRIWAEHGIQSVNLSAGYGKEHTNQEFLDVSACYETAKLIEGVFKRSSELRTILREIKRKRMASTILRQAL